MSIAVDVMASHPGGKSPVRNENSCDIHMFGRSKSIGMTGIVGITGIVVDIAVATVGAIVLSKGIWLVIKALKYVNNADTVYCIGSSATASSVSKLPVEIIELIVSEAESTPLLTLLPSLKKGSSDKYGTRVNAIPIGIKDFNIEVLSK